MVLDKGHDARRVGVEIVVYKRAIKTIQSVPPGIGLLVLGLIHLVEEREIHDGLQVAVLLGQLRILLPGSGVGGFCNPCFTYGIEVGILFVDLLHPFGHLVGECVRIGIHADAIDAYGFNPPDGVLDKVAHEVGVVLIQVGHRGHKPTLFRLHDVEFRSVGVNYWCKLVRSLQIGTLGRF